MPPKKVLDAMKRGDKERLRRMGKKGARSRSAKVANEKKLEQMRQEADTLKREGDMEERAQQANEHLVPIDDTLPYPTPTRPKSEEELRKERERDLKKAVNKFYTQRNLQKQEEGFEEKAESANEHILSPDGVPIEKE